MSVDLKSPDVQTLQKLINCLKPANISFGEPYQFVQGSIAFNLNEDIQPNDPNNPITKSLMDLIKIMINNGYKVIPYLHNNPTKAFISVKGRFDTEGKWHRYEEKVLSPDQIELENFLNMYKNKILTDLIPQETIEKNHPTFLAYRLINILGRPYSKEDRKNLLSALHRKGYKFFVDKSGVFNIIYIMGDMEKGQWKATKNSKYSELTKLMEFIRDNKEDDLKLSMPRIADNQTASFEVRSYINPSNPGDPIKISLDKLVEELNDSCYSVDISKDSYNRDFLNVHGFDDGEWKPTMIENKTYYYY